MAIVFTLLLALAVGLEPVLAPPLLELVLLLLEPQAATRSDSNATAAIRPIPRSARFCVRACMESSSPFVLAESKTGPAGPFRKARKPPAGAVSAATVSGMVL